MNEKIDFKKISTTNKNILDYCQELVMLNHLFETKLLSKDEMLIIKRDIMNSYGVKENELFK